MPINKIRALFQPRKAQSQTNAASEPQSAKNLAPRKPSLRQQIQQAAEKQKSSLRYASLPGSDPAALAKIGEQVRSKLDADPAVSRIKSDFLDIYAVANFMSPEECAKFVSLIDKDVKPSIALKKGKAATSRTSETCRLQADDPMVKVIETRITDLVGISNNFSETIQGQRYKIGQKFGVHNDYFAAGQPYSEVVASEGGQRTWTAMVYLNQVDRGGHTNFPNISASVPPTPGVLLIWNNVDKAGMPNRFSHHEGQMVESGEKYVLTKWFREREWTGSERSDALRR